MPEEKAFLKISSLTKSFGNKLVLEGIELAVQHGEFVGIMGPSGGGKSTLLRLIAGLEKPDRGEIFLNNKIISNSQRLIPPYKRKMSLIFQNLALFPHLTVAENLAYGISKLPKKERSLQVAQMLERLQIAAVAQKRPYQLSGGEKQRVALGRSLLVKPQILLCDEPFSSLDQELKKDLRSFFSEIVGQAAITTIFVSHEAADLQESDRVLRIDELKSQ